MDRALCGSACAARAVLAWTEPEGERVPTALARCPTRVFVEPLELAEVPGYVEAQLARVGAAPEQRALLAGGTLERIALASNGNPRLIQRLADAELAAHAWRMRAAPICKPVPPALRATVSSPRSSTALLVSEARPRACAWRSWLLGMAALAALTAAALAFTR